MPSATWKVLVHATSASHFEAIAFLMPQGASQSDKPDGYLKPVSAIEAAAHLRFCTNLPADQQIALETADPKKLWD